MSALLRADRLLRRLPGRGAGLDSVSLEAAAGDRILLTGPSGSGKSLLLRALAMLDPVDSGTILWRGETVADADVPRYRSQVAYLHQTPALEEGTVEHNLRLPFALQVHAPRSYDRERTAALLERLGFAVDLLDRRSAALSGGERQVVALLRLLQLEPVMLLLDEPTAALDPETAERTVALVAGWARDDPRRAFLWVGHDAERVRRLCNRHLRCAAGRLSEKD